MVADLSKYAGREQAYVKHYFLESYLESLIHKTASRFDEIAYVDGFSGPWQSTGENFEDTSFGVALSALRQAKASWKAHGRDVKMSAHLVERSPPSYAALAKIPTLFKDIAVHTYNGDFIALAPTLLKVIPARAFAFILIDPKGWRIPIQQLAPLLARPNSEVVFNFMFDFINRAASIGDASITEGLDALMPHGQWRAKLAALPPSARSDTSRLRIAILGDGFSEALATIGNYNYVADIPVLRPLKNRTLYSLFYATRHPTGIQVFRECQLKTLRTQATVHAATKRAHAEKTTGQAELFDPTVQVGPSEIDQYIADEKRKAEEALIALAPLHPLMATYGSLWPQVLARHAVTRSDVNEIARRLRKDGALIFYDWAPRKRVPDDGYRLSRSADAPPA